MRDDRMVIRADARAAGAVTALSVRGAPRWQGSNKETRTFGGKLFSGTSECISYDADGNATIFRSKSTRKPNRVPSRYSYDNRPHRTTAADLAPIGDSNH